MNDRQNTPVASQAPEVPKAPDSGRIHVLSNEFPRQTKEDRVADIRAKIDRGEDLCDADRNLFDEIAGDLEQQIQAMRNEARSNPDSKAIYLKMLQIAQVSGMGMTSIAPGPASEAEPEAPISEAPVSSVIVPPNTDPKGITGREETVMMQAITQQTGTPAAMVNAAQVQAPQAEVQAQVAEVLPAPTHSPSGRMMGMPVPVGGYPVPTPVPELLPADISQFMMPAAVEAEAPAPAPVSTSTLPSATSNHPPAVSSNPPSTRLSFPDAQLIMNEGPQPILQARANAEVDPEMDQFMNSTNNPEIVVYIDEKRKLKAVLDEMALDYQNRQTNRDYRAAKQSGSKLGKFASAMVSIPANIYRGFERVFYPKAQIFRELKLQKDNDKRIARKDFESDMDMINTGIDATSEYLDRSYGKSFRLNEMTTAEFQKFFDDCTSNPQSIHYQNVARITDEKVQDRMFEYNDKIHKIEADKSYDQNIEEMLYGSPATPEHDATSGSWYLRAKEWLTGKKDPTRSVEDRPSWIDKRIEVPATASVITYGKTQQALIFDANRIPATMEATNLTDIKKLKAEQKDKRNKKVGWGAAIVAAAGLALLAGWGMYKEVRGKFDNSSEAANGKKTEQKGAASAPTTAPKPVTKVAANTDQNNNAVPSAVVEPNKDFDIPKDGPSNTINKPTKAKTIITGKSVDKPGKLEPKVDEKKDVSDKDPLNDLERGETYRNADSRISAYKRKVALILGSDFEPSKDDEENLIALIDQVTGIMQNLKTHADVKALDTTFGRIDTSLAQLEKQRTAKFAPKYIATAEQDANNAMTKLQTLKALMGGRNRFTIHHPVNHAVNEKGSTETRMPYSVDLDTIGMKLAKIMDETRAGKSQNLSETQAKLDAADAKYWLGYLDFVDWYARYKANDKASVTF